MDKRLFSLSLAALFFTGCANNAPPARRIASRSVKPAAKPDPGILDMASTDDGKDKKTEPDPLADGGAGATKGDMTDPLLDNHDSGGLTSQTSADSDYDPLSGPRMPTKHSHWLHGSVTNARVSVSINGAPFRVYTGIVAEQDITMRCRMGVNTIIFNFTPTGPRAAADIDVQESEHDPPIPPVAVFQIQPQSLSSSTPQTGSPVTKSLTFIAQ